MVYANCPPLPRPRNRNNSNNHQNSYLRTPTKLNCSHLPSSIVSPISSPRANTPEDGYMLPRSSSPYRDYLGQTFFTPPRSHHGSKRPNTHFRQTQKPAPSPESDSGLQVQAFRPVKKKGKRKEGNREVLPLQQKPKPPALVIARQVCFYPTCKGNVLYLYTFWIDGSWCSEIYKVGVRKRLCVMYFCILTVVLLEKLVG